MIYEVHQVETIGKFQALFVFVLHFVLCVSQEKKLRNLDARHVCALLKAEHLGCHSWHSCKALKAAKAKTTISRQAADLQI